MTPIDRFKKRNKDCLSLVAQIEQHLFSTDVLMHLSDVHMLTSQLFGSVSVHLAIEDKVFYPYFSRSENTQIKRTVEHFINEMGGLAKALEYHTNQWATLKQIHEAPARFLEDTRNILGEIAKRARKENDELYPLIVAAPKAHTTDRVYSTLIAKRA